MAKMQRLRFVDVLAGVVACAATFFAVREHLRLRAMSAAARPAQEGEIRTWPPSDLPLPEKARRLREDQAALGLPIV